MRITKASYEILSPINRNEFLESIEIAGRTCYKSEDKITDNSASSFVSRMVKLGHHAMIEFAPAIRVRFITDRGVTHEIVRHRLFSFAQESTRYVNYNKKGIEFIIPCWFSDSSKEVFIKGIPDISSEVDDLKNKYDVKLPELYWYLSMSQAENQYNRLIDNGWQPQHARSVLPNSTKTEIVVQGNVREWRHYFDLRTSKTAHPQIREISIPLLAELREKLPELFNDIGTVEF